MSRNESPLRDLSISDRLQQSQPLLSADDNADRSVGGSGTRFLSWTSRVLFFLNGFTLALPSIALLAIVNDRAHVPVRLLPFYASIAFLPFSFKPIYALASQSFRQVPLHVQIACLLVISGASYTATDLLAIPNHIALCFLVAFLRSVFAAWPEFLLGLQLIDECQSKSEFQAVTGLYQAQAATSRALGALTAHTVSLGLYSLLTPMIANSLSLHICTVCNVVGAIFAWRFLCPDCSRDVLSEEEQDIENSCEGSSDHSYRSCESRSHSSDTVSTIPDPADPGAVGSSGWATLAVCSLQFTVILFALKQPLIDETSEMGWHFLVILSGVVLIRLVYYQDQSSDDCTRVGMFLVLRSAVPTVSYLFDSFLYQVFRTLSMTYMIPVISVLSMAEGVLTSWSFGRFFGHIGKNKQSMLWLLGGTSGISALALFATSRLMPLLESGTPSIVIPVAMAMQLILGVTDEYKFLPSVVLATNASSGNHLRYGVLMSCVDFGDQIGALLLAPLISFWVTDGGDSWQHLDELQASQAMFTLLSIGFLLLLR